MKKHNKTLPVSCLTNQSVLHHLPQVMSPKTIIDENQPLFYLPFLMAVLQKKLTSAKKFKKSPKVGEKCPGTSKVFLA